MGTKNCYCPSPGQLMERTKNMIDVGRFFALGVSGDENEPPFVYTVGCACCGFPEILFVGHAPANLITHLFNDLFAKWKTYGVRLGKVEGIIKIKDKETGESIDYFINLEQIDNSLFFENYGFQTKVFYKKYPEYLIRSGYQDISSISVVQFMLPDTNGIFPGEKGFNSVDVHQSVLTRAKKENFPRNSKSLH